MHEKTFAALDAIHRGALTTLPDHDTWFRALQTISWAHSTTQGPTLTATGRMAFEEMKRTRRPRR